MDYSFKRDANKKNPSNRSSSGDSKTSPSRSSFNIDMESSSNYTVPDENLSKLLRQKGKRATANLIQSECSANGCSENLDAMLDDLLSPDKDIYDSDNIEWCKWIIAGGKSPSEFSSIGKFIKLLKLKIMNNHLKRIAGYSRKHQHMEFFCGMEKFLAT